MINIDARGDGAYNVYSWLLKEGIVFVKGDIDDDVAMTAVAQLLFLQSEAPDRDIQLYINSPGGTLGATLTIYDTMQSVEPKVATLCTGLAAGSASLLLAAGAPGKRASLPHSQIHMHQPSTQKIEGRAGDIETRANEFLRQHEQVARLYALHCKRPLEEIEQAMERDLFMTPEQAKVWGLIDTIVAKDKAV